MGKGSVAGLNHSFGKEFMEKTVIQASAFKYRQDAMIIVHGKMEKRLTAL